MTIESKSDFARRRGVDPSAVSHWLKAGKLDGKALVGEGRMARINVEVAEKQLAERLDPVQHAVQSRAPVVVVSAGPAPNDQGARRMTALADVAEIDAETKRRALFAATGRLMETSRARNEWNSKLGVLTQGLDRLERDAADRVSADLGVSRAQVRAILAEEIRAYRTRIAEQFAKLAAGALTLVPETPAGGEGKRDAA